MQRASFCGTMKLKKTYIPYRRRLLMASVTNYALKCNNKIELNFDGGDLSSDSGLFLSKSSLRRFTSTISRNIYSWLKIRLKPVSIPIQIFWCKWVRWDSYEHSSHQPHVFQLGLPVQRQDPDRRTWNRHTGIRGNAGEAPALLPEHRTGHPGRAWTPIK